MLRSPGASWIEPERPVAGADISLVYDDPSKSRTSGFRTANGYRRAGDDCATNAFTLKRRLLGLSISSMTHEQGRPISDPKCRSRGEMPPSGRCAECSPPRNERPSWAGEEAGLRSVRCRPVKNWIWATCASSLKNCAGNAEEHQAETQAAELSRRFNVIENA